MKNHMSQKLYINCRQFRLSTFGLCITFTLPSDLNWLHSCKYLGCKQTNKQKSNLTYGFSSKAVSFMAPQSKWRRVEVRTFIISFFKCQEASVCGLFSGTETIQFTAAELILRYSFQLADSTKATPKIQKAFDSLRSPMKNCSLPPR